jgi:integrase
LISSKLDAITSEHVAHYAAYLQTKGWQPSSANSSLRVLRRALRLAVEWGITPATPRIKLLRGEHHRELVVARDEELRYLSAASEMLADIATVLIDSGMRPEENARLRWESISWANGQCGAFQVTHGKTAAARRMLPMSPRVRSILERRWEAAQRPVEGWIWAAATASGHVEPSTMKKQHQRTETQRRASVRSLLAPSHVPNAASVRPDAMPGHLRESLATPQSRCPRDTSTPAKMR